MPLRSQRRHGRSAVLSSIGRPTGADPSTVITSGVRRSGLHGLGSSVVHTSRPRVAPRADSNASVSPLATEHYQNPRTAEADSGPARMAPRHGHRIPTRHICRNNSCCVTGRGIADIWPKCARSYAGWLERTPSVGSVAAGPAGYPQRHHTQPSPDPPVGRRGRSPRSPGQTANFGQLTIHGLVRVVATIAFGLLIAEPPRRGSPAYRARARRVRSVLVDDRVVAAGMAPGVAALMTGAGRRTNREVMGSTAADVVVWGSLVIRRLGSAW